MRKPVFGVSDQVQHKPGCTVTEDGWRMEVLDLESTRIELYYQCSKNKGADQLRSVCEVDLQLCFRIILRQKSGFHMMRLNYRLFKLCCNCSYENKLPTMKLGNT